MSIVGRYHREIKAILARVYTERPAIDAAAELMTEAILENRLIYVGHGGAHSTMGLEELFYRAGGLACMSPMFDEAVCLLNGAIRATKIERAPGYGRTVVSNHGVGPGDVVIITTSVGITSMAVDEALAVKELGAKLIAITSTAFAEHTPAGHVARHPSNENLHELADVFINCHVPYGDAVLSLPGFRHSVGPSSTAALSFAGNALVIRTVEMLTERGIDPPVWRSSNTPGGDEANKHLIEEYGPRVKHLL